MFQDDIERVAQHYLETLLQGRWVNEAGVLMEEHYTSHRFDAPCDDQSDKELVETIQKLQKLLKK